MIIYFWFAFAISLWLLMSLPTRMTNGDNLIGSLFWALWGFALWPVYLYAYWRARKLQPGTK